MRVATVGGKNIWKMNFYGQRKVKGYRDWSGKCGRMEKLKFENVWLWQSEKNTLILF